MALTLSIAMTLAELGRHASKGLAKGGFAALIILGQHFGLPSAAKAGKFFPPSTRDTVVSSRVT